MRIFHCKDIIAYFTLRPAAYPFVFIDSSLYLIYFHLPPWKLIIYGMLAITSFIISCGRPLFTYLHTYTRLYLHMYIWRYIFIVKAVILFMRLVVINKNHLSRVKLLGRCDYIYGSYWCLINEDVFGINTLWMVCFWQWISTYYSQIVWVFKYFLREISKLLFLESWYIIMRTKRIDDNFHISPIRYNFHEICRFNFTPYTLYNTNLYK